MEGVIKTVYKFKNSLIVSLLKDLKNKKYKNSHFVLYKCVDCSFLKACTYFKNTVKINKIITFLLSIYNVLQCIF